MNTTIVESSSQIGRTYKNLHTGQKRRIESVEKLPDEAVASNRASRENPEGLTTTVYVLDDGSRWNTGPFYRHFEASRA